MRRSYAPATALSLRFHKLPALSSADTNPEFFLRTQPCRWQCGVYEADCRTDAAWRRHTRVPHLSSDAGSDERDPRYFQTVGPIEGCQTILEFLFQPLDTFRRQSRENLGQGAGERRGSLPVLFE